MANNSWPRRTRFVEYGKIWVCKDRDIVAYEVSNPDRFEYLRIHDAMGDLNNQERVVVFGNSAGGGVVTTLRGKMQGVGPQKVEVDATFVAGNSGSPIVAYDYDAVIGMATYATQEPQVDWTKRSTRFAEVRRFGVRIDDVNWDNFFELNTEEYNNALDCYEKITSFAENEIMKAQWQGAYYTPTASVRQQAEEHLDNYRATPEWMRTYADDAALAAYVCLVILK